MKVNRKAVIAVLAGDLTKLPSMFRWQDSPQGQTYWEAQTHGLTAEARKFLEPLSKPKLTGFATMDPAKQKEIAARGGRAVPDEKRSFSTNSALASAAGKKGGLAVPPQKRKFFTDRKAAADAGSIGGKASHKKEPA